MTDLDFHLPPKFSSMSLDVMRFFGCFARNCCFPIQLVILVHDV